MVVITLVSEQDPVGRVWVREIIDQHDESATSPERYRQTGTPLLQSFKGCRGCRYAQPKACQMQGGTGGWEDE